MIATSKKEESGYVRFFDLDVLGYMCVTMGKTKRSKK